MQQLSICDFGAHPANEDNRAQIQAAIDALPNGGRVLVPAGVYYTSTLFLTDNLTLHLAAGAVLKAVPDPERYEKTGFFDSFGKETTAFLIAKNCHAPVLEGEGCIDLSGVHFVDYAAEAEKKKQMDPRTFADAPFTPGRRITRPILFSGCTDPVVRDLTFLDSPCWTVTFHDCDNALFQNVTVQNQPKMPHSDGVHVSASRNVLISDCDFVCGDDCVAITSLLDYSKICENIRVERCRMVSHSAGIRIGHIASRVRHVQVQELTIRSSNRGIAVFAGDGGWVEDLHIRQVDSQTHIYPNPWWGKGEPFVITDAGSTGRIRRVVISDLEALCDNPPVILMKDPEEVRTENCRIRQVETAFPQLAEEAELYPNGLFSKPPVNADGIAWGKAQ